MKQTTEPPELGGFERRLLAALVEIDAQRPITPPRPPARVRAQTRPAMVTGIVSVVVLVAGGATAAASYISSASPSLEEPSMGLGPSTVQAGRPALVKGTGCQPGTLVSLRLDNADVLAVKAGQGGAFVAEPPIPADTALGRHVLTATCRRGDTDLVLDATITVVAFKPDPLPPPPGISTPGAAHPGGLFGAKGWGCAPGSPVTFTLDGRGVGSVNADNTGGIYANLPVPPDTQPGARTVTATCKAPNGNELKLIDTLRVVPKN